jgi:hypothetical protein
MSMRIDEFDVPSSRGLQEVKTRIHQWLKAGKPGSDYILMEVSDQHMKIRKEKHNPWICCFTCIASCFSAMFLMMFAIVVMALNPFYNYGTFLALVYLAVLVAGVIVAAGFGFFFLRPHVATYVLRFSEGMPLRVTVYGEGIIGASEVDYDSLKSAILSDVLPPAPAPW